MAGVEPTKGEGASVGGGGVVERRRGGVVGSVVVIVVNTAVGEFEVESFVRGAESMSCEI